MSIKKGDVAPDIKGTDLVSNAPWSLYAQADADVMLAFVAITAGGPSGAEASALAAVWNELKGQTESPFTMAIIGGIKGPGGPPPQETVTELKAAIDKYQITCPVVLSPPSWMTYLFPDGQAPALYCLHWIAPPGQYKVGEIYTGIKTTDVGQLTTDILAFLAKCGVHKKSSPSLTPNLGAFLAIPVLMQLFGGGPSDGGGWGITFGGRPIPIPPWDPLRAMGSAGHDAVVGLLVAALADQIADPSLRDQVRRAGVSAAKVSIDRLASHGHK